MSGPLALAGSGKNGGVEMVGADDRAAMVLGSQDESRLVSESEPITFTNVVSLSHFSITSPLQIEILTQK